MDIYLAPQFNEHFQAVLKFMQANVPTAKLVAVAERLPEAARLLWGHFQQEPFVAAFLEPRLPAANISCATQSSATESAPVPPDAGDDSVVERVCP
jgi:hypothetical protein